MNGIINLLKPPCLSSAQAVSFVKRLLKVKVGHAGTLDPEACGVLPIMVGKATRLFDYIAEGDKVYVAEIAFGLATDTQDATGRVIARGGPCPDEAALRAVLPRFVGDLMQTPPAYSALKVDGEPLYKLARRGQAKPVKARPVQVHSIDLLRRSGPDSYTLRISCGKGTYIRTLCHDIGQALRVPAHMRLLVRERVGSYRIEDAITPEELAQSLAAGAAPGGWFRDLGQATDHLQRLDAPDQLLRACVNGQPLPAEGIAGSSEAESDEPAVLYCQKCLIGLYERRDGLWRPRVMLYDPLIKSGLS